MNIGGREKETREIFFQKTRKEAKFSIMKKSERNFLFFIENLKTEKIEIFLLITNTFFLFLF